MENPDVFTVHSDDQWNCCIYLARMALITLSIKLIWLCRAHGLAVVMPNADDVL